MNGVLIVDKPAGFTSFDVVAKLRGILHMKRIGHGGTLDPEATGVLPVFIGEATKLCDALSCGGKCYEAGLRLGMRTDTEDIWGQVLTETSAELPEEVIRGAVLSFIGDYAQVPPMYSAKKINGKKLYEIARKGATVERKAVPVRINGIEILSVSAPDVLFRVNCSKGTYIRSLCRDIGERLGTGGCMSSLRRLRHGNFGLGDAHTLAEIEDAALAGRLSELLIPVERLFDYPHVRVTESGEKRLLNGNVLESRDVENFPDGGRCLVYGRDGRFRAIYGTDASGRVLKAEQMFLHS